MSRSAYCSGPPFATLADCAASPPVHRRSAARQNNEESDPDDVPCCSKKQYARGQSANLIRPSTGCPSWLSEQQRFSPSAEVQESMRRHERAAQHEVVMTKKREQRVQQEQLRVQKEEQIWRKGQQQLEAKSRAAAARATKQCAGKVDIISLRDLGSKQPDSQTESQ